MKMAAASSAMWLYLKHIRVDRRCKSRNQESLQSKESLRRKVVREIP